MGTSKIQNMVFAMLVATGWMAIAAATAMSQTRPTITSLGPNFPSTEIFIGNSFFYYNNSMHNHLLRLEKAADPDHKDKYRASSVTISGSGIDWHDVKSYFRPNAIGSYSFDEQNNIVFNKPGKLFDVAIMMDCSQCPIDPTLSPIFKRSIKKDSAIIRTNGAQPVFFMSWAYADKPEMTARLAEAYTVAGNENKALVIPAGLAFARAIGKRPDLNLYSEDKRHPSLAGTYLSACTVFAALTGRSPVGNSYLAGIEAPTAQFLQTVAWETVQDYYGK